MPWLLRGVVAGVLIALLVAAWAEGYTIYQGNTTVFFGAQQTCAERLGENAPPLEMPRCVGAEIDLSGNERMLLRARWGLLGLLMSGLSIASLLRARHSASSPDERAAIAAALSNRLKWAGLLLVGGIVILFIAYLAAALLLGGSGVAGDAGRSGSA